MRLQRALWLAALFLGACQPRSCSGPRAEQRPRPATDAVIAVQNLDAQIREQERVHARSPEALEFTAALVGLLETRAQFLGRLSDYDRALALAEDAFDRAPANPGAVLLRAGARSALHQFAAALGDLDRATALGGDASAIAQLRASILQAQGHLPEALVLWRKLASSGRDIRTLGSLAVVEWENGNREEAARLFTEAVDSYRDVSPFPPAWIEFQQGLLAHGAGEWAIAQKHYEAARAYLPQYAAATEHLAEVLGAQGEHRKAAELLRPLVQSSEDPEHAAQLAKTLVQLGKPAEASRFQLEAGDRYDALIARHPEAFADHAARFWLPQNPVRALALARKNLASRRTPDAFDLAISAALGAGETALACELADEATATARPASRVHLVAARAFDACGKSDRARRERIAASSSPAVR